MGTLKNESGIAAAAAVLAILVIAVLGFTAYKVTQKSSSNSDNTVATTTTTPVTKIAKPDSGTKAADLRSTLVRLGEEHMLLVNTAVDQTLDASPAASASTAALIQNGKDIGAAVGSIYGKDAEATFDKVWQVHVEDFVKYAGASAKGDTAAKAAALKDIDDNYTKPLSAFLAKANPNLPEKTLSSSLDEHVQMTAAMIDLHVAKKYTEEYAKLAESTKHIEGLFSTLASGIVKQYPAKF
jgi:hypothetical protein